MQKAVRLLEATAAEGKHRAVLLVVRQSSEHGREEPRMPGAQRRCWSSPEKMNSGSGVFRQSKALNLGLKG